MNPDGLLARYSNVGEALRDKGLACLGDALVNLIYSLALSFAKKRADGGKISNLVLERALVNASLRQLAPSRADRQRLANVAESVIAYFWLRNLFTITNASKIVADELAKRDLHERKEVRIAAEAGFTRLLLEIKRRAEIG